MDHKDLHERLKKLLIDRCGVKEELIRPEANLQLDLHLDSLDAVQLAVAVEDEFNVTIQDEDLVKLVTVANAAALVQTLLEKKPQAAGDPASTSPLPAVPPQR